MTAEPAPAAAAARIDLPPTEAAAQVLSLLRSARSKAPAELLTAHLTLLYSDTTFAILRAAAEATHRRLQIVAEEKLRVVRRPRTAWRGDYQTARAGRERRPYTTSLLDLDPLRASCDCPDFRGNSLGLCKHVLAVLADLAHQPKAFERLRRQPRPEPRGPSLHWDPVKPLHGDGDWLQQVVVFAPLVARTPPVAWRSLLERCTRRRGDLRLTATHTADPSARLALLDAIQRALDTNGSSAAEPALRANLADERARLEQTLALRPHRLRAKELRGFRRKLYPYQRTGVSRILETGRLLLADDMGLGKTTQAIAACHVLTSQNLVTRGLLIVPASLKHQWLREWQACTDLPLQLVEGPPEDRARLYRTTRRGFLIANYEQILRDLDVVRRWCPDLVLLDEAQRMKNWETRTATTIKQLEPRFRVVLTGTPFENRVLELDSILEWLDRRPLQPLWRLMPFHQMDGGAGLQHLGVLRERLAPVVLRRRRQEVLDQLPARADTRIDVPMTEPQREEHDAFLQPIAQLLGIAERRPLTQAEFLKLMMMFTQQRIASNGMAQYGFDEVWPGIATARPEAALLDGLSMPKLAELRLLVQQVAIDQGRKIVVFSQWRRALQLAAWAVGEPLARAGVHCTFFTGAESLRRRNENIVAFHDDPATRVLFATDAGGVGLNLQKAASCCVHFDLPWNPAVFEQRVGRIWRLGQTEKVDVYSLVSEDCIESRMAEVLKGKQATFAAVFDGDSDEVRFERQGGFLAAARRIAGGAVVARHGPVWSKDAEDGGDEDAVLPASSAQQQVALATTAADGTTIDPSRVRSLLAGLTVQPRADGGMVLQADRESAAVLAEVLRGLAGAIEGAVGSQA